MVGDHSLLCLDGDEWEQQHRLIAPALRGERIDGWRAQIADIATAEINDWPVGETIELRPRMQRITLDVIIQLVFGIEDSRRLDDLRGLLPELLDTVNSPFVFGWPAMRDLLERRLLRDLPGNPVGRFLKLRDRADELIHDEISRRRADHESHGECDDLLSTLLSARDDDGQAMGDDELHDELMTLLVAGHETTSTALAWTFERLVRHQRVLTRRADRVGWPHHSRRVVGRTGDPAHPRIVATVCGPRGVRARTLRRRESAGRCLDPVRRWTPPLSGLVTRHARTSDRDPARGLPS